MNFDAVGEAYGHGRQADVVEAAKRAVTRRALQGADAIVTWSHWAAASAVRDYGVDAGRVHAVPPGVDVRRLRPMSARARARTTAAPLRRRRLRAQGWSRSPRRDDAPRSSRRAGHRQLVGSGAIGASGQGSRRRRPRTRPFITDLFRRADVFVLPSRGDCTPLAVAEALACGLPVVATPVGGMPELVRHGENGLLVPPGEPEQLARALRRPRRSAGDSSVVREQQPPAGGGRARCRQELPEDLRADGERRRRRVRRARHRSPAHGLTCARSCWCRPAPTRRFATPSTEESVPSRSSCGWRRRTASTSSTGAA